MSVSSFLFGTAGSAASDATKRQKGIDAQYTGQMGQIAGQYGDLAKQADVAGNMANYQGALGQDLSKFGVDPNQFQVQDPNALASVNSYLDPSLGFQMDQATKQVQASAAGQGGLFSGAAGQEIAGTTQKMAEQGWGQAFDRARTAGLDKNQATLQNFGTTANANQMGANLQQQQTQNAGASYLLGQGLMDQQNQILGDVAGTTYGSGTNLNMMRYGTQAADTGFLPKLFDAGIQAGASYLMGG